MIVCNDCGRFAQMTYHEELDNCPYCASDSWHIYHLQEGHYQKHNIRAMKAIRTAPMPPRGRCFLTPKGKMVQLGVLRGGADDDEAEREKTKKARKGR